MTQNQRHRLRPIWLILDLHKRLLEDALAGGNLQEIQLTQEALESILRLMTRYRQLLADEAQA